MQYQIEIVIRDPTENAGGSFKKSIFVTGIRFESDISAVNCRADKSGSDSTYAAESD